MYRIGIDVGGTNTDAVIMQGDTIVVGTKSPTTEDVMSGVVQSLNTVLEQSGINKADIAAVMIGTTHFTNAVVERRQLVRTAAVRLCLPAAQCLPPMVDWPADIREAVGNHYWMVQGGNEFDGREISAIDEKQLSGVADEIASLGIDTIAISSVFSPVSDAMEKQAREIMRQRLPDASYTLSSEIGRLGLLERESAAIMNASLLNLSEHTVKAFAGALQAAQLSCPYYITQNDGTLMNAEFVQSFPVLTFASGPTNSMRGASFLSGEQNAIVVDVGGTSTDVGALIKGFPRSASTSIDIGGVRTNFRMPDVYSIALGGGTRINPDNPTDIGPESVGFRIQQEAIVFGGNTLTCTDVIAALGLVDLGNKERTAALDHTALEQSKACIDEVIINAVERMRVSSDPVPVLAVGGGSILIPDQLGDLSVVRPEHYAVANAVGAAIGQISGEVDRIYSLEKITREEALAEAQSEATEKAIKAGANPASIELLDKEDVPLAYLPGNATRIRLKVVGDLDG
jgi:N-methylhydantoinase A/oxoprolinase/acetone carboxylase beta subunit